MIALTTDFGTRDWFVGTMKGVIARVAADSIVVDLTHEIAPGDIRAGAFALRASYRYFPKGTVHLVVVDPGVGTARRALAVRTQNYVFVGPDNGVLSWALAREKITAIHAIENQEYCLQPVSQTFHGRDIFAPAAAHLSAGVKVGDLGPKLKTCAELAWPRLRVEANSIQGEVMYIDRFGNAITNIDSAALASLHGSSLRVFLGKADLCRIESAYGSVGAGQPLAVLGSSGFLEIAVNGGSAYQVLGLEVGTAIGLRPGSNTRRVKRPEIRLVRVRMGK
jgi:S-adenosylmethionine hydrolase